MVRSLCATRFWIDCEFFEQFVLNWFSCVAYVALGGVAIPEWVVSGYGKMVQRSDFFLWLMLGFSVCLEQSARSGIVRESVRQIDHWCATNVLLLRRGSPTRWDPVIEVSGLQVLRDHTCFHSCTRSAVKSATSETACCQKRHVHMQRQEALVWNELPKSFRLSHDGCTRVQQITREAVQTLCESFEHLSRQIRRCPTCLYQHGVAIGKGCISSL